MPPQFLSWHFSPCQQNRMFHLKQHELYFSKFCFLDLYKKKLKYIMQDLNGKRLNLAVNLSEMLWTGSCLFYDRVYEFLWAQRTFYCTLTPALEPSIVCVFFTRATLKIYIYIKSNSGADFASSVIAPPRVVKLASLSMAPSAVEQLTTVPAGPAEGGRDDYSHASDLYSLLNIFTAYDPSKKRK